MTITQILTVPLVPILLSDDGMRLINTGFTSKGNAYYVSQENPTLIVQTIAERRYREIIRERNYRTLS